MSAGNGLTRRQQLSRISRIAREALENWGFGDRSLRTIHHFHNTTLKVGDRHVLRVSRPGYQSDDGVESELRFVQHLRAGGLPVPASVPTKSGEPFAKTQGHQCALFEWIPGRFANASFGPKQARLQGELVAGVHARTALFKPGNHFDRRTYDADILAAGLSEKPVEEVRSRLSKKQLAVIDESTELVRETWARLENPQPIHTDITPWNTMWVEGRPQLIDFDDLSWGPFAYDLGVVRCEYYDLANSDRLWDEFVGGYSSVRPLPAGTEENLDGVVAARHLLFAMWLADNMDHPAFPQAPEWIAARVTELRKILRKGAKAGASR